MKIEVWADFASPQCYVFSHLLSQVLSNFPYQQEVVVEYRSMPSLPTLSQPAPQTISMLIEELPNIQQIQKIAQSIGLVLPVSIKIVSDTKDAHRLMKFALAMNVQRELLSALMNALFIKGIDLNSRIELIKLTDQLGLNTDSVERLLAGTQYGDEVQIDVHQAHAMDVKDLPFIVFNSKYALSGLPTKIALREAIRDVWDEEHPDRKWRIRHGMVCTSEGCVPYGDNEEK